ncbi:hypothetical protein HK104_002089 [Borealophlyctis nickersoniae]|nr:hypothetical protein HK104_002089 [Borealophlyctis nickersoniae]
MSSKSPQTHLYDAQKAVQHKDYALAATHFTAFLSLLPPDANPALCLLSRCTCYLELKQFEKAKEDAERILKEEDVKTNEELVPGCYSTHVAAAKVHEKLGNASESASYKTLASQLLQASAANLERSVELKEEGNELYRAGDLQGALEKYEEALKENPVAEVVLSNATQVLIKLGRLEEAEEMAERCVAAKPEWSKGWYRKGMVAMKQQRFRDAAAAFQSGLEYDPDDADLKKCYMEAARRAEKTSGRGGGFDKRLMGMMMELRHNSWDVPEWFSKNRRSVNYWSLDDQTLDIGPHLGLHAVQRITEKSMRVVYPSFKQGMVPVDAESSLKDFLVDKEVPPDTAASYILPSIPLITLAIFRTLFTQSMPSTEWSMVWTFHANPGTFTSSSLYQYIAQHRTYCALVSRDRKTVVDFLSIWAAIVDGDKGKRWFEEVVVDAEKDKAVWYTGDDEAKFLEFLEGVYGSLREGNGSDDAEINGGRVIDGKKFSKKSKGNNGGRSIDSNVRAAGGNVAMSAFKDMLVAAAIVYVCVVSSSVVELMLDVVAVVCDSVVDSTVLSTTLTVVVDSAIVVVSSFPEHHPDKHTAPPADFPHRPIEKLGIADGEVRVVDVGLVVEIMTLQDESEVEWSVVEEDDISMVVEDASLVVVVKGMKVQSMVVVVSVDVLSRVVVEDCVVVVLFVVWDVVDDGGVLQSPHRLWHPVPQYSRPVPHLEPVYV